MGEKEILSRVERDNYHKNLKKKDQDILDTLADFKGIPRVKRDSNTNSE